MNHFIPYNKPFICGKELDYIQQSILTGKISGNGHFTKKCHQFFEERYGFKRCLMTTSCTDALEMTAILIDTSPDDEIIMPSFTFVSTSNAFVLRGAKIVFADSESHHPNLDADQIEKLITKKTKAIVVVHYAGVSCDMDKIMNLAKKHKLFVIEDAAQCTESFYKGKPLGGIGDFGCFSFHETKNLTCGEGGMLVINDEKFIQRAEIIWEKGTNRVAFGRGEINKYNWVDIGSSFLPSDLLAAFLFAQLECIEIVQEKRKKIWKRYFDKLKLLADKGLFKLPTLPDYATNNAHIFYLVCNSNIERNNLIEHLKKNNILAIFHYLPLHLSPYYGKSNSIEELPNATYYSDHVIRLPLFYQLSEEETDYIINTITDFYVNNNVKEFALLK